jgi:hypothetical protein
MVLSDEETGIDRKDLTVRVQRYAVSSLHVTVLVKIGDELIVEPPDSDECGGVIRYLCLQIDRTLEYTPVFSNVVLRIRHHRYPLRTVKVRVVYV